MFRFPEDCVVWVTKALKTITSSAHRNLEEVSIYVRLGAASVDDLVNARRAGEATYRQWMELDALLVQIWEARAVGIRAIYSAGRREEAREYLEGLLPEATRKGAAELVYFTDNLL